VRSGCSTIRQVADRAPIADHVPRPFLCGYPPRLPRELIRFKTLLRKIDPRTTEATGRGIGTLLDRFKPKECANYLVNAGYASA
jgi:hypothetical protein